jgi:hypothetical protein
MKDVECPGIIQYAWENAGFWGEPMLNVRTRLTACQHSLLRWSGRKVRRAEEQLNKKSKQLLELQNRNSPTLADSIKIMQFEIEEILEREDVMG